MPQFDVSTFSSQIFWLIISFVILFLGSKFISLPKISSLLKTREDNIENNLNDAENYNRATEDYHMKLSEELDSARTKARENISGAIGMIKASSNQRKAEIVNMTNERIISSENHIERQKEHAYEDVKEIAKIVSEKTLDRLLSEKFKTNEIEEAIDEILKKKVA